MPERAHLTLHPDFAVGAVSPHLFGSFVEHMGRCVYGGIYEPGHQSADGAGFRGDVAALVRELGVTIVRYPGGNFVSSYKWEDGIGDKSRRPVRYDLAWRSLESNQVGTDEFIDWSRELGIEPLLAVNLGTRGLADAAELVEYCNLAARTTLSETRAANGHPEPHGVRFWCLGNEVDGDWQIGHKTAHEYGRLALEAGRAMRAVDPSIRLAVCGSSNPNMPGFGAWEATVLEEAWDVADYISLHAYFDPADYAHPTSYLACGDELERAIDAVAATIDAVSARRRSAKRVAISLDEWNVWHMTTNPHVGPPAPVFAPAIAEDEFTIADALAVGSLISAMLRRADRIGIGCLAQLVKVLGPIRTDDAGRAWRQTTFFPFALAARQGRGTSLRLALDTSVVEISGRRAPALAAACVLGAGAGSLSMFALNRVDQPVRLTADLTAFGEFGQAEHVVLGGPLEQANTAASPSAVQPRTAAVNPARRLELELEPYSFNVVTLTRKVNA